MRIVKTVEIKLMARVNFYLWKQKVDSLSEKRIIQVYFIEIVDKKKINVNKT